MIQQQYLDLMICIACVLSFTKKPLCC